MKQLVTIFFTAFALLLLLAFASNQYQNKIYYTNHGFVYADSADTVTKYIIVNDPTALVGSQITDEGTVGLYVTIEDTLKGTLPDTVSVVTDSLEILYKRIYWRSSRVEEQTPDTLFQNWAWSKNAYRSFNMSTSYPIVGWQLTVIRQGTGRGRAKILFESLHK